MLNPEATAENLAGLAHAEQQYDRPDWMDELQITVTPRMRPGPEMIETYGEGVNGSAVITTSPANAPLHTAFNGTRPNHNLHTTIADSKPDAAAVLVLTNIFATAFAFSKPEIASCEPPLNPNQPIHRMRVPSAT